MSFAVPATAYDRFMGRYSGPLSPVFADFAGVTHPQRVLDVGCGPGALTSELVSRVTESNVTAVDPSLSFVESARARLPGVRVERASAEALPFPDDSFDTVMAQLVVHFMTDPVAGIREMGRVTRRGGTVSACVWDHGGGRGPLSTFWALVAELDPGAPGESQMPGAAEGDLARIFDAAGLSVIEDTLLTVEVTHPTFQEWWEPYTLGVGPAGDYVANLDEARRERFRAACEERFVPPFTVSASAWATRAQT
jgi:SAM-dependent methyltransferase